MSPFRLHRFEADQGTFAVAGRHTATALEVSEIALLSTDGWVQLDLDNPRVKALLDSLEADILMALDGRGM
ncbi:MAG: hypothetical protein AAGA11_07580 [Pseudomonadota bacterium]